MLGISMFTPKEEDEEKIMINDIEIDFSKTNMNLNDYQDILTDDDKLGEIYKYLQPYLPETVKKVQVKEGRCILQ